MPQRAKLVIMGVFVISLGVRLIWVASATVTPVSDFRGYDRLAQRWLATGEFGRAPMQAYRTPGYPAFLAGIYAVCGQNVRAVQFTQAVLGAVTSALVVLLAARMLSVAAAGLAGLFHAFSPTAVVYTPVLASENLGVPVLLVALLLLGMPVVKPGWRHAAVAVAGVCLGLLVLLRPAGMFFLPAMLVLAVWQPLARRWRPLAALTFVIGLALPMTPWLVRNARIGLGWPVISSCGGVNLWMGNNPEALHGGYCAGVQVGFPRRPERARDQAYRAAAVEWIREHPARYVAFCGVRAARLLGTTPDAWAAMYLWPSRENDAAMVANDVADATQPVAEATRRAAITGRRTKWLERWRRVVAPLTLVALGLSLTRWRTMSVVLLPVLSYGVLIALTFVAERFREMWNPLLVIPLAALLADVAWGTQESSPRVGRRTKALLAAGAIAVMLVLAEMGWDDAWYQLGP